MSECDTECEAGYDACPPRPELSPLTSIGSARLTPWGEEILFAQTSEASLYVAESELPLLWGDADECRSQIGDWASLPGAFPDGNVP